MAKERNQDKFNTKGKRKEKGRKTATNNQWKVIQLTIHSAQFTVDVDFRWLKIFKIF